MYATSPGNSACRRFRPLLAGVLAASGLFDGRRDWCEPSCACSSLAAICWNGKVPTSPSRKRRTRCGFTSESMWFAPAFAVAIAATIGIHGRLVWELGILECAAVDAAVDRLARAGLLAEPAVSARPLAA